MEARNKVTEENTRSKTGATMLTPNNKVVSTIAAGKRHKRLGLILKSRYRIESLIASGGMSDVYRAVDQHLEKAGARDSMVAVKILRSELTQDASSLGLLAREAAKSKRLSHPNIIRVHDLDHDGDTWFMVMELLDGEPLSRIIQRAKPGGLTWNGGRAVLKQVVAGLAFSHQRGIVHADLKPSNIFFTREGEIKLLDFGVAQALKPHQQVDFLNPQSDDETTIYGYTPAYASPELIAGKDPAVKDDLYALACIAYELLSSRHPFDRMKLSRDELKAYALSKPKNMPLALWRVVRDLLKTEGSSADLSAFQRAMQPIAWSTYLYPAGVAASLTLAAALWYQGDAELQATRAQLDTHENHAGLLESIAGLPPADLLDRLGDLQPIEQAGLLKLQQERILDYFNDRVDDALKAPGRADLPNVPAALAALTAARDLYPGQQQLIQQSEQLSQRSASLQSAIAAELQGRLEQGDYKDFEALEELSRLAADLEFLGSSPLMPSSLATQTYDKQLTTALASDDGIALAKLLTVGNLFFSESPELEQRLSEARELEDAIATLGRYHQAVKAGQTPDYPRAAAEQFYASRFRRWQEGVAKARTSRDLDVIYNDVIRQQKSIPPSFAPLAQFRQRLADAYVNQADALLAKRRTTQAQPLLRKATELMRPSSG